MIKTIQKKIVVSAIIMIVLILLLTACATHEKVKNSHVKELVKEIEMIDGVYKIESSNIRGVYLRIDIYVQGNFLEESSHEIFGLIKEYLNINTANELMEEFNSEYPPDIRVYIRNKDGEILFDFIGSYFEPVSDKTIPPIHEQYKWWGLKAD